MCRGTIPAVYLMQHHLWVFQDSRCSGVLDIKYTFNYFCFIINYYYSTFIK